MAHPRREIREAVRALLVGKTAAGSRVYETQMVPYRAVQLPAIAVFATSETVDPESQETAPRELKRTLRLVVAGFVKSAGFTAEGDNVDDAMDDLALEIEKAMHADPYFGGAAGDSILASVELDVDEEGGKMVGGVRLTYSVTYRTDAPAAADLPPLDDLTKVDVKTDLGGTTHAGNQAEDLIPVPIT